VIRMTARKPLPFDDLHTHRGCGGPLVRRVRGGGLVCGQCGWRPGLRLLVEREDGTHVAMSFREFLSARWSGAA
jgi:hypothetical protein